MSDFEVLIESVGKVEDHPNADRLSIVNIRGYQCISAKVNGNHRYKEGDRVVYVPEGAVVPEFLLKSGFWDSEKQKGVLAGSKGDRVKAVRLRGLLSQGILYSVDMFDGYNADDHFVLTEYLAGVNSAIANGVLEGTIYPEPEIGQDVAELLGIIKYEPEIPTSMRGEPIGISPRFTTRYDFENIKKVPNALDDLDVVVTEKLHGTMAAIGVIGEKNGNLYRDRVYFGSKGLLAKNIVFKYSEENLKHNIYVKTLAGAYADKVLEWAGDKFLVIVFGEIFGKGIQDLGYGTDPTFRGFDIFVRDDVNSIGRFLDEDEKAQALVDMGIDRVPLLYKGPFSWEVIEELVDGKTTIGNGDNIREGIVITPTVEQTYEYGRLVQKHVSADYLTRRDATEFN